MLPPEPPKKLVAVAREHTPIESLDSSESDFPRDSEAASEAEDGDERAQKLRRDSIPKAWEEEASPSSLERESVDIQTSMKFVEQVDVPVDAFTPETPRAADISKSRGGKDREHSDMAIGSDSADTEEQLNKTLTPIEDAVPLGVQQLETTLLPAESLAPEGDYTQRSGTYRKSTPSILSIPAAQPASGQQLEYDDRSESGDYLRRSGTFRKKKPSLASSPTVAPEKQPPLGSSVASVIAITKDAESDVAVQVSPAPTNQDTHEFDSETLPIYKTEDPDVGTHGQGNLSGRGKDWEHSDVATGSDAVDTEDQLDKTLTPTEEVAPSNVQQLGAILHRLPAESLAPEGDYTQRSGTYRKSTPSVLSIPTAQPASGQQLEYDAGSESGDYLRRSGTFRKKKPSLASPPNVTPEKQPPLGSSVGSVNVHSSNRSIDTAVWVHPTPTDQRRLDFGEGTAPSAGSEDTHTSVRSEGCLLESNTGNHESNLKRSSTFRKERSSLDASPIVSVEGSSQDEEESSNISPEDFAHLYSSKTPEPGDISHMASLSVPEAPQLIISSEESDNESVEETIVLVDGNIASGLKRSGTFTKERPTLTHSRVVQD